MLGLLGIDLLFAERGRYVEVTLEEAASLGPDLVVAPSEPYPFSPRQLPELGTVGPVVFVDGKDLFWWGVRTAGAIERLGLELGRVVD